MLKRAMLVAGLMLGLMAGALGQNGPQPIATTQCITNASAQGTTDAITIAALPCALTTNVLYITMASANLTANPTLQPLGLAAQPIVRFDGGALVPGDWTAGSVAVFVPTGFKWLLMNPLAGTSGGGFPWVITDGSHTVNSVGLLTVSGGVVGGTSPNATLTISAGGSTCATNAQIWTGTSTATVICPLQSATALAVQAISDSAGTISINYQSGINWDVTLVHADCPCTLANPTNVIAGSSGQISIIQSATGSDLINTYGSTWKFAGGNKPTYSTSASAVDTLTYFCRTTTFCELTLAGTAFQ